MSAIMAATCQHAWRPSAAPTTCSRPARGRERRHVCRAGNRASPTLTTDERELLAQVNLLGYPAAIFPGDEPARAAIDLAISRLEAATPTPSPLLPPSPLLEGDWQLIYASSGTYVTRTRVAQALLAASALPGVGVADIRQGLTLPAGSSSSSGGMNSSSSSSSIDSSSGSSSPTAVQLRTSNAAEFGLGPFGDWEVEISGIWDVQNGELAVVTFDGFTLQLVGLLGLLKLPRMAKVSVPIKNSISADFSTTYLSDGLRVARGRSSNTFLFSRRQA